MSTRTIVKSFVSTLKELILLDGEVIDKTFEDERKRKTFISEVVELCEWAFKENNPDALFDVHQALYKIYSLYLHIPRPGAPTAESSATIINIRNIIERHFLEYEEQFIPSTIWREVPGEYDDYKKWLLDQVSLHPSHDHPLYEKYLREQAGVDGLRTFIAQESTIDARFDDFLAMIQTGTKEGIKLEIGSNYWDEMGQGIQAKMHSAMFARIMRKLDIEANVNGSLTTEALACGNLSLMLSLRRQYFYKAIGYFAVTEYLAPRRFRDVITAWRRNRLDAGDAEYYEAHVMIDRTHADNWFTNVIKPALESDPEAVVEITRGAFYRLNTSQRYLDRLMTAVGA
ncbi:MAG TPA: iron-containing redox enzyme family protein [Terriglobales bacterium]|nr:iron-containing redox enzyme family protein [Terriglobales bacterium]